ncbi:MAG: response regulator [Oceanospirillaceae bacterium]|nr:response regulator [Oceanospirillaceae bacterium]
MMNFLANVFNTDNNNDTNKVLVGQLETMFPQIKFLLVAVIGLTSILVNIFWDKVDTLTIMIWVSANALVILSRVCFIIYSKRNLNLNNAKIHAFFFALGSLMIGFIWSAASFIFLDFNDPISVIVMVTVLTGTSAGALVTFSAYLPAFYLYNTCVLGPLAWLLINQPVSELTQLGYIIIVFWASLIGYSHAINRNLQQFILMRFENVGLLKNLTKQLDISEQASVDKSRYLAATSHDLRQPLHALQLFLGNLGSLVNPAPQQFLIAKSIAASTTLNRLLSALMDVSRLDSGEVALDMQPVLLDEFISEIAQEFQIECEQNGIDLAVSTMPINVVSDPLLLGRCLRNLLSNAIAHAAAKKISIICKIEPDNQVIIQIVDDGVGIKYSELDNVFSEFYQLKNPERDRNKGLGLGLAIVKKLTTLMDHQLSLSSVESNGCTFSIQLSGSEAPLITSLLSDQTIDISGVFIVVVDDDPDICEAMSITLKRWGCEVIICNSTQELIDEFNHLKYSAPDVIIADYRLRDNLTGVDTIKQVRAFFDDHIPAIIMSGDAGETVIKESAGLLCHYQQKPISLPDLKKLIKEVTSADA